VVPVEAAAFSGSKHLIVAVFLACRVRLSSLLSRESVCSMKVVCRVLLPAVLALSLHLALHAQQVTGIIRGTVFDPSGAVVSSAVLTVTQTETGFSRTAATDPQGDFILVELPVGHYRLAVDAPAFQPLVREGITLEINQSAFIPVHLTLGTGSSQVQVTADAPLIENSSSTLGKAVDQSTIQDLPLNGRHFTQLGTLQPGVVPITQGLSQAGGSLREGQAYAVNGQRPESNNFLIDGADNFNNVDGGFVMEPPVDAIAEFRILTHTANARAAQAQSIWRHVRRSRQTQQDLLLPLLRRAALTCGRDRQNRRAFHCRTFRRFQRALPRGLRLKWRLQKS
jgi:carboxypeptidase family protein